MIRSLKTLVTAHVTSVSGMSIQQDLPLIEAGLDSLSALSVRDAISTSLGGIELAAGLLFDYPTVSLLCIHLHGFLFPENARPLAVSYSGRLASATAPITISNSACRLPGTSSSNSEFWFTLATAHNPMVTVPDRWDANIHDEANGGFCYTQVGGFIPGIEQFDSQFFLVASNEAAQMDPQQRVVLEVRSATEQLCCFLFYSTHSCFCRWGMLP
jgi:hypothetical protein